VGAGLLLALTALAQTEVPSLKYTQRTLANGLRVFGVEDHFSPTVAIQVWYHVGSKDDPDGRSGFAHLFEHMMFKSTKNMPAEMMDRLTEDVGGENNATTRDDMTIYFEVVPSNYLETLLWAEADRLATLTVDEANFKSERDVVKEEFRQNYVASPYGKLWLLLDEKSFTTHPYKRPGIGNIEELNASKLEEVRAFHGTYYRPDNATLVVVGDFDSKQLDGWVDRYFGRVAKPEGPMPRVTVKEPPRTAEKRYVEHGQNVPLPAVLLTYLTPPAKSDEAFALRVAQAILSEGTSSRLYQSLVYKQQVAQSAEAFADLREDAGLLAVYIVVASDKTPEQAEKAALAELERLGKEPPAAAELEKAKNKLITGVLRDRETNEGKAFSLGEAAVFYGDPDRVNTDIARLQKVSAEDVQRVAQTLLSDKNRVVIQYLPEAGENHK
jgi:zinc protease